MATIFTFKNKRTMPRWLAAILAGLLKLYCLTLRLRMDDVGNVSELSGKQGAVLVSWHNRSLFLAPLAPKFLRSWGRPLVSASRDGEYISTLIRFFGFQSVRGSSSRGGAEALLALRHCIDRFEAPMLTVDGPRGPRYVVHPGAAALASSSGSPIIPIMVNAESYWEMKSWDRMQIPKPFSRVTYIVGEPLVIPPTATQEEGNALVGEWLHRYTVDREA